MDNRRQSIDSNASTTLSSFVKKRFNGDVPIFGGNISTGIAEATRAVSNSVQANLATALLAMSQALVSMDQSDVSTLENTPISIDDKFRRSDDNCDAFLKCAELDYEQLRLLSEASIVTTHQIEAYKALIYATYDVVWKKPPDMDIVDVRKDALADIDYSLTDDELERLVGDKLSVIKQFAYSIGINKKTQVNLIIRAFIHNSSDKAQIANRCLAIVGNASLTLILRKKGYMLNITVGRMSYLAQKMLSNRALYEVGMRARLQNIIVVDKYHASDSITAVATTVEALFGVAEVIGGEEFVLELNNKHLCVCEFENLC